MDPSPPAERDVSWDAPHGRAFAWRWIVPMKANVEVASTGHAYAPFGRPVKSLTARLVVGSLEQVHRGVADGHPDLRWGALQVGHPFARMPLVYERAAGGTGTWNIAGDGGWAS